MSSKIKVDTIENVAGSGNVSLGSGHNLVVPGDLTVDTSTLKVDSSNNRVGIGTASPSQTLETAGNIFVNTSGNPNLTVKTTGAGNNPFVRIQADTNYWDLQSLFSNTNDELDFRYNGTSTMMIDKNGVVTKPSQTYFRVRKNADQSNFATGTNVVVTWETEDFDVGSNFASNTFTAPVDGIYLFHLTLRLDQLETASNYYSASINTSNREYRWIEHFPTISDKSYFTVHVTAIIDMDVNDTADARIYQHSSTAQTDIREDSTRTLFYGYLLG